jgi:hypothetical protein
MSLITCITSSKEGQLLLARISGITETFMRGNLEDYDSVPGSRKRKYISYLSRFIVNSRASWSDKNRIMTAIGILPTDKICIFVAAIHKERGVIMRAGLSKDIYVTIVENFYKIKEICVREPIDISISYNGFLKFIHTAFQRGFAIKQQIDRQISEGQKGLRNKKRVFTEIFHRYIVLYRGYMDIQTNSICSTVYLNDDVKNLIYSYL